MTSSHTIIDIEETEPNFSTSRITLPEEKEKVINDPVIVVESELSKISQTPISNRNMVTGLEHDVHKIEPKYCMGDIPDPKPIRDILKDDDIIRSLEKLSQEITKKNKSKNTLIVKENSAYKLEVAVTTNSVLNDLIFFDEYEANCPPPPYSYNEGKKAHTEQVYMYRERNRPTSQQTYDVYDGYSFDSISIRNNFVAKVYAILLSQLLITCVWVLLCMTVQPLRHFVMGNLLLLIIVSFLQLILMIMLACFTSLRRMFPINFILLFLFTLGFSYIVGYFACSVAQKAVLYAVVTTAAIVAFITVIAWLNFFDTTSWGFILAIVGILLIIFGIISTLVFVFTQSETMYIVYCYLVVLLFTVYLLYDTQQILGGGRVAISSEEYIFAALTLYCDIMYIFIYLMQIFGRR